MAILVAGGAGYIGSHTVAELLDANEEVVIVDNLEKGHKGAVLGGVITSYRYIIRSYTMGLKVGLMVVLEFELGSVLG